MKPTKSSPSLILMSPLIRRVVETMPAEVHALLSIPFTLAGCSQPCAAIYALMSSVSERSYSPFLAPPPPPCIVSHKGSHRISFLLPHMSIRFPVSEPLPTESQRVERERGAASAGQSLGN